MSLSLSSSTTGSLKDHEFLPVAGQLSFLINTGIEACPFSRVAGGDGPMALPPLRKKPDDEKKTPITLQKTQPTLATADMTSKDLVARIIEFKFKTSEFTFLPASVWKRPQYTLQEMIAEHFKGKSCRRVRFEHKLWNALQLSEKHPELYFLVGVIWLNESVIQVNRLRFGKLLDLGKSTSALFSKQGSFPTHGFVELSYKQLQALGSAKVLPDSETDVRFFCRPDGRFKRGSTAEDIEFCRYIPPEK